MCGHIMDHCHGMHRALPASNYSWSQSRPRKDTVRLLVDGADNCNVDLDLDLGY